MKIAYRTTLLFFIAGQLAAQNPVGGGKWWVEFTDKKNSPYCLCRPAEILSARALERRARAGIALEENDIPVNPLYVKALLSAGVQVHNTSRWLNAATVIADSVSALSLTRLPFVQKVEYAGPDIGSRNPPNRPAKKRLPIEVIPQVEGSDGIFGYASLQNSMLGLPLLYALGHRGKGIWMAVMDGGFSNVDTIPFFDSIALSGRLYQGRDFVERDTAVFESAQHGTSVLSVMASDMPGYFIGTAPEATYFLLKTEDTGGEYPVEEANWIAGAEWADSIGVDVINASLGYTVFNDTTLSHRYVQLDGRTAIGSRGASIAGTKGMIIFNSAGNSGDEAWKHLGVPADAPGIIAVGAVEYNAQRAGFSSVGPTADGRLKPELVAPGDMVVVAGGSGTELGLSSGTSLASPMLAGAVASLWSAFPEKTAAEILDAVFRSADQSGQPDNERGYGLPDMTRAWLTLNGYLSGNSPNNAGDGFFAFDRLTGTFSFLLFDRLAGPVTGVELRDGFGRKVDTQPPLFRENRVSVLEFQEVYDLTPGVYQVIFHTEGHAFRLRGLVWR